MFTVKRTTTSLITSHAMRFEKYEYQKLIDAIKHFEDFKTEDKARYEILMRKHPELYFDNSCSTNHYHFTVGDCEVYCEIDGLYESANDEFYIKFQKGVSNNEN